MEIIRAGLNDTNIFNENELSYGACCFFTEDRTCKYYFKINGREATLYANTDKYIPQAVEEFLFYSGFITLIKNEVGNKLFSRTQDEPYLCEIEKIQPSQFYINEKKLENVKKWIKSQEDIYIPIVIKNEQIISLDGHTRMRAALDLGYTSVYVYLDDFDDYIFRFANEALKRRISNVCDMELVTDEEYKIKWHKFCDNFFER